MRLFKSHISWILVLTFLFDSCTTTPEFPEIEIVNIPIPTKESGQSRVISSKDGKAFLSWIEYGQEDIFTFQYAQLVNNNWSEPITIATGDDWFINWADFPSLIVRQDGSMAAHWLQMRGEGTYEYDVHIGLSSDGYSWNTSFIPHRDSLAAEHGFVSMINLANENVQAVWLDGRNMAGQDHNHNHGGGQGAMTLRTAQFDHIGRLSVEYELDQKVCECCQTDMVLSNRGPVVVYRNRSNNEIRDISIVRNINGKWSEPVTVFNDEWKINGCPVNGPAIDAHESDIVVAWYTAAKGIPTVKLAFSKDGGQNFDLPFTIDEQDPLGRVDVKWINQETAFIVWLADDGDDGMISGMFVKPDGRKSDIIALTKTRKSRRSGFPVIENIKEGLILTWTHVEDGKTSVRTSLIKLI